jgi:hypothetical protein
MLETNQGLCPLKESPHFFVIQRDTKHFESGSTVEIAMLPKIDLGGTALSKQTDESIIVKILSHTVRHKCARF